MAAKTSAQVPAEDLIWLCRRLASALQVEEPVLSVLDSLAGEGPPGAARAAQAMRRRVATGDWMGRGLADIGTPAYVWGSLLSAETQGDPLKALAPVADLLEFEQSVPRPVNNSAHCYALGLRRLGMMLAIGVPLIGALEATAETLPDAGAREALLAARKLINEGAELSDTLAESAHGLPPLTIEMIRDAERDNRLVEALPVIADYLLDVAQQRSARRPKREVHNG
ncbi:MAG: type II secretion system F family protein [Armatimonadota bacterium]